MPQEITMVAMQANLSAQIATEHLAAKKWWEDFGLCFIEGSKMEDFTYEERIKKLKTRMESAEFTDVKLRTSNESYGVGKNFTSCGEIYHGIKRDRTIG